MYFEKVGEGVKMKIHRPLIVASLLSGMLVNGASVASASVFTFGGTIKDNGNTDVAASASFSNPVAGELDIVLTNTYTGATADIGALLTAITFTDNGVTGTSGSAQVALGSLLVNSSNGSTLGSAGANISSLWGAAALSGSVQAVAAAGGNNYVGQTFTGGATDGGGGGIVSRSSTASLPMGDGLGSNSNVYNEGVVDNSVLIKLFGNFDASKVDNVIVYFGTAFEGDLSSNGSLPPPPGAVAPEPASVAVWGIVSGLAAGAAAWRKQKLGRATGRWSKENRAAIYKVVSRSTI